MTIEQELKENPLKTFAAGLWTSLIIMRNNDNELVEYDWVKNFPNLYMMAHSYDDTGSLLYIEGFSGLELTILKQFPLDDNQNMMIDHILQFRKNEKPMTTFNESKLQEYFVELLFNPSTSEIEIEKLKILSDVLKFIHENQIEESIANRKQEDYQRNFDRFMKYWKDSNIKDLLIEYLYKKLEKKND